MNKANNSLNKDPSQMTLKVMNIQLNISNMAQAEIFI